eukprot:gene459-499_t
MGATASLQPESFSKAKEEYEKKKNEGLSDEELFNHMKAFIEGLMAEQQQQPQQTNVEQAATTPSEAPPVVIASTATEPGVAATSA